MLSEKELKKVDVVNDDDEDEVIGSLAEDEYDIDELEPEPRDNEGEDEEGVVLVSSVNPVLMINELLEVEVREEMVEPDVDDDMLVLCDGL